MARSNGPFGPPGGRPPLRRDSLASLQPPQAQAQVPSQVPWPTQGYADHGHQPAQPGPAYHFPPPDPEPNYGYNQPVYAPQQWGQQDQRYDLANYLPSDPPPFQNTAHHQQAYAEQDPDYGDDFYDDEEPRRGRRWMFIAAALIGAIGVGGALAYTYRSFVAPSTSRVPLVKNESPVKVKEAPAKERKLPTASPPAEEETKNEAAADQGPRKVPTFPVGPGKKTSPPPVVSDVPGISLDNSGPPPKTPSEEQPPLVPPPADTPPADDTPPTKEVATVDQPPAVTPPPPAEKEEDEPPPQPKMRQAALRPPPPVTPPPSHKAPPSSALGYVAVVSSQRTHMDALKAYADAVEKHPDVLGNKTPDVLEVNLGGDKGIRYRAVVGPPGSREGAMRVCSQLKAAGHDCWVTEYRGG
jgi:SPOR domain